MKVQHWFTALAFCALAACNSGGSDNTGDTTVSPIDSPTVADTEAARLKKIRICTELLPPPPPSVNLEASTDTFINKEFDRTDTLTSTKVKPNKAYLSALTQYRWRKDTINVTFLDGDPVVQQGVMAVAKQWEDHAGVTFNFDQSHPDPDITISFMYLGSWSYHGTYSRKVRPSMNYGWLDRFSSPQEYQRVVLHEFGHALGFIHEHLQPNANIPWNVDAVYKYYSGPPNNWDTPTIKNNIFLKYSRQQTNGTRYDSNSIMHYYIPPELTDGVYTVLEKSELSDLDKRFAGQFYPKKKKIAGR